MNRSWVRFPQAAQIRPPGSGWAFFMSSWCLVPHGCSGRRRPRPPARLGDLTSFGAVPRSPPVPSGPSGALHASGAGSLMSGSARRLEARPGPATAHRHRSQAHQSLRRPPRQWGLVADVWLCASSRSPARPRRRPRAPQPGPPIPPAPSTPVGLGVLTCACASSRSPARPRRRPRAPQPGHAIAHGHRSEAPPQLVGITGASRAAISGRSLACCYKRRQSTVFFVWISDPLLQTSSIRRLFR